ncbi:unnamed protein product, partial [Chrysoparadoxa australica]
HIQKFHSSEYINALANGDICVAVGWSGDVLQARDRAAEADNGVVIGYYAPDEGAQMWFDQMAIPVDAPNPDAAHAFLNFIMDAQNMAAASNYVYYANGNKASQELLAEDVIGDPAIYPDAAAMNNTFTTTPYPPKVQRVVTHTMAEPVFAPWNDPAAKPLIQFKSVTKRFGDFTAIDDLTQDIFEREFFALLGPSGCGKTTLMRMLAGFEEPTEGQILLDGRDIAHVPPNKRAVNMMFQSYALFPHLSVYDNIAFGLRREKKPKDEVHARVQEMLRL